MTNKICLTTLFILSIIFKNATAQNCNCTGYLYLNDTGLNYIEKFRINADGSLSEIGDAQNGMPWLNSAGFVDAPHGITGDLNGNLYIGEYDQPNNEYNIQKYGCSGQKLDANLSTPGIDNFTDDGFSFSQFIVGDYLYANIFSDFQTGTGDVIIYDLCTGNRVGCMREAYFWGLIDGMDGYWYATGVGSSGGYQPGIYRGLIDPSAYTDGAGGCGSFELVALDSDLGVPGGSRTMGIDQDLNGNLYVAVSAGGGFNPPSYIIKIDPAGNIVAQSQTDTQIEGNPNDNLNWAGSRALVYNNGYVYVSSGDDCIAVFDATNLDYQPALSNNLVASFPKQMSLVNECCPVGNTLVIDTLICSGAGGSVTYFLQDLLNCDAALCEGEWSAGDPNPNVVYDPCDNSLTVNVTENSCTSYTLASGGSATNAQCGQFTVSINFESAALDVAVISADQNLCAGVSPQPLSVTNPTAAVTYQWQSNTSGCTNDFTNILNATSSTYNPSVPNQTTYYRVITTLPGNCSTKSCSAISNCVTITTSGQGSNCINQFGEFIIEKRGP